MTFNQFLNQPTAQHRPRDYWIIGFAFAAIPLCFAIDAAIPHYQAALGVVGWICLAVLLSGEDKYLRAQIVVAVLFATLGEYFASIYMAGYTYRLGNVPPFVPPGHGIVYLTAVVLARSGLLLRWTRFCTVVVLVLGGVWSLLGWAGIGLRADQIGTLLFVVYLLFLFKGRSKMVYLGAFFITAWVEIIGTVLGVWNWAPVDPASHLLQGNPPSGVVAWYCLVDFVAIQGAAPLLRVLSRVQSMLVPR